MVLVEDPAILIADVKAVGKHMMKKIDKPTRFIAAVTLLVLVTFARSQTLEGFRHYFFLSDQRIVTVELINQQKAILNYINLGDTYEFLEAPSMLILDSEGHFYHGHALEIEDPMDPSERFKVSELIQPHVYIGYNILGNYRLQGPAEKVFLKVGSRILELEAVFERDFDFIAARVGALNLAIEDGKEMVLQAGFREGHGIIHKADSKEAAEIEAQSPDFELIPPVVLAEPRPLLPSSRSHLPDPVVVQLMGMVMRSGGLSNPQVVEGIDPELDRRALATVENSWSFLPAISKGKVVDTELTFNVVFRRE
jgi:hypothetical protein